MLWYMIKSNLKLMLRSKWILGIMLVGPIIVIAALSSAFHSIMETNSEIGAFQVGYSMKETSPYQAMIEPLKQAGVDNDMEFVEYPADQAEAKLKDGTVAVFVEFTDQDYILYTNQDYETQAAITKYLLFEMFHASGSETEIPVKTDAFVKVPNSTDYYGKIEIIYFLWCGMFVLSTVVTSERKYRIQQRLKISPASDLQLYLAKVIPCFLANMLITAGAAVITTYIFGIHWGCYLQTIGLLVLGAAAVSAFAVVLFYLIQNVAIAVVIEFVLVWILGFFGGSFEAYMFSSLPNCLKEASPIYHMNRALVEYETEGISVYGFSCMIYLLGIIAVCFVIGRLIMKRRLEDR